MLFKFFLWKNHSLTFFIAKKVTKNLVPTLPSLPKGEKLSTFFVRFRNVINSPIGSNNITFFRKSSLQMLREIPDRTNGIIHFNRANLKSITSTATAY